MKRMTLDGNAAVAYISYALSELAVIYPITPSSPMAELADIWASKEKHNLFGKVPRIVQMQSESGVAGALHGALSCGALATSYTCSQGLLLMLPELYKLAGELLPTVVHASSRALSTHALSIFGDHQDVMACRQTGCVLLASSSVQECMDFALAAHLAALECSLPVLHFFDGFRTSHEVQKIDGWTYEELQSLFPAEAVERFRKRALSPDSPLQRGTTQNADIYFQNRERANPYFLAVPRILQVIFDRLASVSKRQYHLFDYFGAPDAEHVIVLMGSGAQTAEQTVGFLASQGEKAGSIVVRLYRPFDGKTFCSLLPASVKTVSVLDRTKEAGSLGEPLYLDVVAALAENGLGDIDVLGGRYGLGGKEFTPADVFSVLENAKSPSPKKEFTVGIDDDVTSLSLGRNPDFRLPTTAFACKFYGLGSDGTVGANKNSIQCIGEHTPLFAQGYFCYDSKKSGGVTVSHLRYGTAPIAAPYLIDRADFIACHNPSYLERYALLSDLKEGGTFLLNCPWESVEDLERELPTPILRAIAEKHANFYVIDAAKIVREIGLDNRISTLMQAAFFYLARPLPFEEAKALLKRDIESKYRKKGDTMVAMNALCVDKAEQALRKISYPESWRFTTLGAPVLSRSQEPYFQNFILPALSLEGDRLPVSAFTADGSVPTGTSRLEKHGAPPLLPKWLPENCIQCNQCAFVCPHACIRPFVFPDDTPTDFQTLSATGIAGGKFRIQVSPHDCMGCGVCAQTCPTKEKALVMSPAAPLLVAEGRHWEFAQTAPQLPSPLPRKSVKGSQFFPPLFEFSYACSGCGETPYIKVLTQLFGERMVIANATGCSSIYGGSAPTCPYAKNHEGKGPAWANSLFEDNAEFGYGMRLALEAQGVSSPSVWCIGGDGWAYDIGFGGLDHVLASNANVNVLVLDSEVYSNTGGQVSKATPTGAVARFAERGKSIRKKDLGGIAMRYERVYVAQVSMGADKKQLLDALTEAEAYDGPALVIAYSPCIAHGVDMGQCMEEEKLAVESGYWHLYRFNPAAMREGKNPLSIDSNPTRPLRSFLERENRFMQLLRKNPERANELFQQAEQDSRERYRYLLALREYYEKGAKKA